MCSLQEHSARSHREEMARQANQRVRIIPATGELLPAEERLQNVLKAIVDRMMDEQSKLHADLEFGGVTNKEAEERRAFISGLDIAWSLAKTESLKTDGSGPTVAPGSV